MHPATPCYYHIAVDASPDRAAQIQRILAAHVRYWGLDGLATSASRGIGLLVELAAEQRPDGRIEIEAWWNGQHLINAVSYDGPAARHTHELSRRCSTQIAAMSDGWGSCTANARHIVWFSLRSRPEVREALVPKHPTPSSDEALRLPRVTLSGATMVSAPARAGTPS
ncbi:pep a2 [Streptomyces sp. Q6]|uniref:Pep a2 n=1 Tax=Streptomyces citrinus TaxID=3118173 RepID=A0ACD5AN96_9ACTN